MVSPRRFLSLEVEAQRPAGLLRRRNFTPWPLPVSEVVLAGLRKLEADEAKLQALRARLQAGEDSPLVEDFN